MNPTKKPRKILRKLLMRPSRRFSFPQNFRTSLKRSHRRKQGIVEIVSILLLITVAIAGVTIMYAYVIGFIGNVSQNTGQTISIISIDSACASRSGNCIFNGVATFLTVVVRNAGSVSIPIVSSAEPQVYISDLVTGTYVSFACNAPQSTISTGQTYTCSCFSSCGSNFNPRDMITIKVVDPDGGTAITNIKAIR